MPHIADEHDAILGPLVPHLVLERVVKDETLARAPRPRLFAHADTDALRDDETQMAAQPIIGRAAMRVEVGAGREPREEVRAVDDAVELGPRRDHGR
eukprot:972822-Prymnesium_polylepis.1